jgi:hypothetical protein
MVGVIVEWISVGAWSLLVIISSNAAAEFAKERLGKAYRTVIRIGVLFSTIAGVSLIVFICERVFGMQEIDLSLVRLTRLFNNFVESIFLPFLGFFSISGVIVFYGWAVFSENNKDLGEILDKRPEATFNGCFMIAVALALIGVMLRLFGVW